MTRADQYEEWAADRVSEANHLIRGGQTLDDLFVDRHLERAAELLSKANAA